MIEESNDLFSYTDADVIFITTNGVVKESNGEAVMGRGCALQALRLGNNLAKHFGDLLNKNGNIPMPLGNLEGGKIQSPADLSKKACIWSFPTKHHWRSWSDIELIKYSTRFVIEVANEMKYEKLILPRPGCSNGGLEWSVVKNVLEPILDDRFIVVHK